MKVPGFACNALIRMPVPWKPQGEVVDRYSISFGGLDIGKGTTYDSDLPQV